MVRKEIDKFGNIRYFNEQDQYHREDGPAVECPNGEKHWYLNNFRHRIGGPAVEYPNGSKFWYKNNLKHRLNAPAVIHRYSGKEYWEFGKYCPR